MLVSGKQFTLCNLKYFFDSCTDLSTVQNSTKWLERIDTTPKKWKENLVS